MAGRKRLQVRGKKRRKSSFFPQMCNDQRAEGRAGDFEKNRENLHGTITVRGGGQDCIVMGRILSNQGHEMTLRPKNGRRSQGWPGSKWVGMVVD